MPTVIYREAAGGKRTAAADKTTTSPHSCTSHRRAAAHRRAGGRRAQRLLIFRFWVDFEEIYLYFVPPRGPAPRISPSAVTAGHEAVDTAELSMGNFALLGHREVPAVVAGLNEVMKFNE